MMHLLCTERNSRTIETADLHCRAPHALLAFNLADRRDRGAAL